ncbi:MAG TPA: autotransporter-associated beta strand repeat-containing protein, partial [Chthoniobacteraceae bacterium]|nr:autotransporter-associated beta strand repeat-containing protein [Chthoniobacteraceae bacterium]
GTLTLTGASPNNSPSTAAAGNTTTTGDNNINITNPTTIVGGGIYLGIDGTGIFNHNSGTVTTNWIVLDNRGDTGPGNNMNGLDQYNLTAGTLNIRSNWGIIGRNGSTEFNLKGGTVRVDNTGTGTGTGANITVPFDVLIRTAGNSTLDTNGAGNAFTLTRPIMGTGTIALAGGGTINLNPTGYQAVLAGLSGTNPIVKLGTGITAWRGSGSAYTGTINVSAGRLELPTNLAATSVTVADGAAVAGEPTIATVTLGATTGATLFFDPNTAGAFKGTSLVANGTTNLDFSAVPTGAAPWTAITYTNKTGAGTFAVANAANYRSATATDNGTGTVSVNVTRKNLTWTATGGSTWDINTTSNWDDSGTPEKFFAADTVTFGDTGAGTVTINSQVSPWGVTVNSGSAYTFSGTGGITGPGGLTKTGAGTLTIANTNTYAGQTAVNGGTLTFSAAGNLGNSSLTNTLALSGGGRLNATTGVDLGINRSIALGTGGGTIAMTNAAAQTVTISGNLTGTTPLGFTSGGAGAAAFYLTGDNSGYTGAITVDSAGGGVSTLRLGSPTAIGGGSVTLLNPISGASGNATTLDLNGYTLPTTAPLFLNASLSGANNYRSQVLSNAPGSTINSPIQISGNAGSIVQFSSNTANGMTLNGNVTAGNTGFDGSFLIRGSGQGVINGTVNLPNASVNKTDAATWTINSTGNTWLTTNIQNAGSLKLGVNNALPITATLNIGQGSDASNSTFDLNGFNQEVANLTYTAGNGNSTRGVTNTSATRSTLTVNNATDTTYGASTGITGGILAGNLDLVKNGSGTLTLAGASSFTGNVVVNSGTLVAGGATVTSLGSATTAGRMVTINSGATLSFTTNNVFGNGVNNNNLPSIALNGSTLTSTRYNVLGNLTLNGATLTQEAIDAGNYEGFQFRGNVAVTGTAASTILTTNGKANHVGPNTTFDVADVTGSAAADLTVSAPLRNQSGDFANAIGGLTKTGAGTMELSAVNTYTGSTVVNAGTLLVSGSIAGAVTANTGATLAGGGTVGPVDVAGGTVAPGAGVGTLSTGAFSLNSSAVLRFELAQAGVVGNGINDLISVTGNLTLDGTLAVTELSTLANGTYRLFTYTGTLSDQGLAIDGTFLAAHPGSLISTATAGEVSLVVIPEPTALVSLLGGMGVLLGSRRFRSSRSRRS